MFENAFKRITESELGIAFSINQAKPVGTYEHLYPNDNYLEDKSFSTHYLVNAFHLKLPSHLEKLPSDQHTKYWWATESELLNDEEVHINTRNYFNGHAPFI